MLKMCHKKAKKQKTTNSKKMTHVEQQPRSERIANANGDYVIAKKLNGNRDPKAANKCRLVKTCLESKRDGQREWGGWAGREMPIT